MTLQAVRGMKITQSYRPYKTAQQNLMQTRILHLAETKKAYNIIINGLSGFIEAWKIMRNI